MKILLARAVGAALLVLGAAACAGTASGNGAFAEGSGSPAPTGSATASADPTSTTDPSATGSPTESPSEDSTGTPSADDEAGDQRVVAGIAQRWYRALGAKDGGTVCGLMTAEARTQVQAGGQSCEQFVENNDASPALLDAFRRIEVNPDRVLVNDDRATVLSTAVKAGSTRLTGIPRLKMVRQGDGWLISSTT